MPYYTSTELRGLAISVFTLVILTALIIGAAQWLIETLLKTLLAIAVGAFLRWIWMEFICKTLLQKDN